MAKASKFLYGMHDFDSMWAALVTGAAKTAWVVETLEIGDNPNDNSGVNFTNRANYGLTVIGRLNYSHHGAGTIPTKERYDEFAIRCGNYVRASQGCTLWIIGNEPNITGERPDNSPITPADYVRCYKMCRDAIKAVSLDHQVMVAPVAPYNDQTGWCIDYWQEMLRELVRQGTETDGFPLHTYSRGPDVSSIRSEQKMDGKYSAYYNGFRAYRDFLAVVPPQMAHLRAYITETDQLDPWADINSGWVKAAYLEIDDWNNHQNGVKINSLCLYRWPKFDQWWIIGKNGVIEDFKKTLSTPGFLVPEGYSTSLPIVVAGGPTVTITAPAGANIRSGPGTGYAALGALPQNATVPVTGVSADGQWWQVRSPWGTGWVYVPLVKISANAVVSMVETVSPPIPATPQKSDRVWLVNTLSRVLGIDPLVAKAVISIESAGNSFGPDGNMIIRFENHVFRDAVAKTRPEKMAEVDAHFKSGSPVWTGHQWRQDSGAWQNQHDGGQAEEWATFNLARKIDESAAMQAISMGAAQILGTNYRAVGYDTPQEMFNAYNDKNTGEFNQIAGFFAYVRAANLVDAIRAKDWRKFAASYNGSGQVDYYANAIATKYAELGGKN